MYYAHFILNKKGPLAKIWLAAHWDKKLTKAQIYETNIESTIEAILEPQMKLALRTSGHLLLGVCRIYSRKVKYLLADCNEAFVKIKLAFRPGLIDLPKEKQQAAADAITLPEKFPEFYVNFTDMNIEDMDLTKNLNQQARVEDITLKEDFGTFVAMQDDDFGDMGSFGMGMDMDTFMMESDMERGRRMGDASLAAAANNEQTETDFFDERSELGNVTKQQNNNDLGQPMEINEQNEIKQRELDSHLDNPELNDETMMQDAGGLEETAGADVDDLALKTMAGGGPPVVPNLFDEQPTVNNLNPDDLVAKPADSEEAAKEAATEEETAADNNKTSAAPAVEKQIRTRRRRKLIIDDIKEIDSATMKAQLSDTNSILGTLELAPPTRKLMQLKETGGVDKLFAMTGRAIHCRLIAKLYTRNMTTKSLADITNTTMTRDRLDKSTTSHKESLVGAKNDLSAVEVDMNDHQTSKQLLPLVDSFIDNNNADMSRAGRNLTDLTLNKDAADMDDMDMYHGGPASVYNANQNLDDILLDHPIQSEVTPAKVDENKAAAKESGDEEDEEEEEEEEEGAGAGGTEAAKNKSAKKRKRSYRKSMNATLNATLVNKDELDENDETIGGDPSKNLTKRAKTMVSLLNKGFNKNDNVGFFELIKRNGRKSVVQKFYSLLVLKKYEIIELTQAESYGDIIISKGDKFENFAPQ